MFVKDWSMKEMVLVIQNLRVNIHNKTDIQMTRFKRCKAFMLGSQYLIRKKNFLRI